MYFQARLVNETWHLIKGMCIITPRSSTVDPFLISIRFEHTVNDSQVHTDDVVDDDLPGSNQANYRKASVVRSQHIYKVMWMPKMEIFYN